MTRNIYKSQTVNIAPDVRTYLPISFESLVVDANTEYVVSVLIHVHVNKSIDWFGGIDINEINVSKIQTGDRLITLHGIYKNIENMRIWVILPCEGRVKSTLTISRTNQNL